MNALKSIPLILIFSIFVVTIGFGQQTVRAAEDQIEAAVSTAPENLREEAKVLGYDSDGTLITLREGTNELICLADDPNQSNFHVACYHEDLDPFMKRGRELKAQGLATPEVDSVRRAEIEAGNLAMPRKAMALYSLTGSEEAFNYETGTVDNASPLYVVYVPFATETTTGLSTSPASEGAPWIMEPGTPWAHIMVITGRDYTEQEE